jgi:hypothetical protein
MLIDTWTAKGKRIGGRFGTESSVESPGRRTAQPLNWPVLARRSSITGGDWERSTIRVTYFYSGVRLSQNERAPPQQGPFLVRSYLVAYGAGVRRPPRSRRMPYPSRYCPRSA